MEVLPGSADSLIDRVAVLGTIAASTWIVHFYNFLMGGALNTLGIRPRVLTGLIGIPLAPFLHSTEKDSLGHLPGNTGAFFMLGGLVLLRGISDFVLVSIVIMLLEGFASWLLGRANAIYIGASGVIYGYGGFLLLRGYFERNGLSLLLTVMMLVMLVAYEGGAFLQGFLPSNKRVAWEGHLFGFIAGLLVARYLEFWKLFF
ncbi:MAG: rhomboid family intramembrane serine protease [Scytolyngbya sp. HA4215-MV1]|jgi:membrane associated rhomboid family serine protease|nr:rhomboid family intramembrane serine protease [Scytolyngbya sp. HA4215-MV1]